MPRNPPQDASGADKRYGPKTAEALRDIAEAKSKNSAALMLMSLSLTAIPTEIFDLQGLKVLRLIGNQITAIPDALGQMVGLQELHLNHNQITAIPDSLGQLTNLTNLIINNNQIKAVPDSLGQLAKLAQLYLSDNLVSALPDSWNPSTGAFPRLTHLYLHDNPLGIPDEILGPNFRNVNVSSKKKPASPRTILNYYFALHTAGNRQASRPLREAKLILVGRGDVGKTSIVKKLVTGKFKRGTTATQGIQIDHWPFKIDRANTVNLHVWDFGGQELMHATHQFFLTKRSLYLLVLTNRDDGGEEDADLWFRYIRTFGGPDAPVIVVLNKQKEVTFDVNRRAWLEKYKGNIKAFVQTDCTDAKSIKALEAAIRQELADLESLKASFPSRWFAIKEELARMEADFVTFEGFQDICRKHGEQDTEQQTALSGYLNDLGIALNYKDDPRLNYARVLKPEWVTKGIYALLHAFIGAKGLFTPGEAETILFAKKYNAEAAHFILGLMERFELSFPLGDSKRRTLIPQLLDQQQPEAASAFDTSGSLKFSYLYTVLPDGLLPRFIVRTHHLGEAETRWKTGVILTHPNGCQARAIADKTDRQVRIDVTGPATERRDLLAIIRYNFDVIHSDYGIQPIEFVYPNEAREKALDLAELKTLQREGETQVRIVVDQKVVRPAIAGLVDSVAGERIPLRLFLSYSHANEKEIDALRNVLKPKVNNGEFRVFYDRALTAGEKWEPRLQQELREADVVVCQVSSHFLSSDFCMSQELAEVLKRPEADRPVLIAYILHECDWKDTPQIAQFQILPKDGKPLKRWKDKHEYWQAVLTGIKAATKDLKRRATYGDTFAYQGR